MSTGPIRYERPQSVELIESRWHLKIRVVSMSGTVHDLVVSADAFYTDGSGIWFGTQEEFEGAGQ